MKIDTEQSNNIPEAQSVKPLPFLVKATALLLIVYGVIGFGYYLFVLIYSIVNPHFLENLTFNKFSGNTLFIPVSIEVLVHVSVLLSGFLLLYKKKTGLYFYYFSLFFSLFYFIVIHSYINYAEIIMGFLLLIILVGYRSRLSVS